MPAIINVSVGIQMTKDILTNDEVDAIAYHVRIYRPSIRGTIDPLVASHRAQAARIEEQQAEAGAVIRRIKAAGVRGISPQQLAHNLEHGIEDDD